VWLLALSCGGGGTAGLRAGLAPMGSKGKIASWKKGLRRDKQISLASQSLLTISTTQHLKELVR